MNRRFFLTALLALPIAAKLSRRPKLLPARASGPRTYDPSNVIVTFTTATGEKIQLKGFMDDAGVITAPGKVDMTPLVSTVTQTAKQRREREVSARVWLLDIPPA